MPGVISNFSKFFPNDEVRLVVLSREGRYLYLFYLLQLVVIFFFLFPLWRLGHYGVLLWLTLFIICLVFFGNHLLRRNTIYIVTKVKIWHVFFINDNNIKLRGAINIGDISRIEKMDNNLLIHTKSEVHNLNNIKNINSLYSLLSEQVLSNNEKSGII